MITLLAVALAAQASAGTANADGYVGRWNVRITDATDTFVSGGFQIGKKDGALEAGLVWRSGSYLPAKSVAVKDGALHIVREARPGALDEFLARLEGESLKGHVKLADGTVQHFEGKRAPALSEKQAPAWGAPITLFDGKTLGGWKLRDAKKKNGWAAQNGELAVVETKDNADLVTERTFQDLKLHLEFNMGISSGTTLATTNEGVQDLFMLPLGFLEPHWYAIYTCANHEKRVSSELRNRAIEHFLPIYNSVRRWKDRRINLDLPLFPGYVFVRLALRNKLNVLQIPSVVRFVGFNGSPVGLPDDEMEILRSRLCQPSRAEPHPFLTVGRRVRITSGAFAGLEGVLKRKRNSLRVVVSVGLIERSVAVDVELADVAPAL
jgi:transcription antitermination factor NusG